MADAPKILGTDSLRQAYPKLNSAINNSNEALNKSATAETNSTAAVNTANQANEKSDDTQTQLNAVVNRATDSDAMSAQAAVDAKGINKGNLKQRIDDDYNELSASLAQNTTEITKIKEDNAISPEKFTGTDFQKVQAALDYAIANDVSIKFAKIYNITGAGALSINKANGSWDLDRRVLFLQGVGGGIRKDDGGFIFTAPYQNVGDINVNGLKYYSVAGVGTKVWDCDKIIRVTSMNCKYLNVDTVASAANQYCQTMKFIKDHVTGGNDWAFEFKESWDTEIDCLIEARQNGIRNTVGLAKVQNNNLKITGVIEGLSGIAVQLGSCYGLEISGYFEKNHGGHIDLQSLDQHFQYGVLIMKNTFSMTPDQITNNVPAVKMGKIFTGGTNGVTSISNICNGILYNTYANEGGWITGIADRAITNITGRPGHYLQLTQPKTATASAGDYITWGPMSKQNIKSATLSFAANETKTIDLVADPPALAGDPISFSLTNSANFRVEGHEVITNAVRVHITNKTATAANTVVTMSLLKLF
ncbi:hypothetical protein RCG19_16090 [Neobacillus sp. OS1-2]|uniref:hypothetical protein n=1 Tax=Neobacillus sp. OS1-2 TaxID=3070680 RepID=UPI0027DFC4B1|nr:hypothetical protein [Neobacillus sp. OS1-2]WML38709.1 hypothetical protein RCG19_16090 [Neobacillus sp. OS1-2]